MNRELQRSLLVNTIWAFIGKFGYLAIGLITNIILVRLLGAKEFGQVGIVMFFIAISSVLIESGLSGALVRKQNVNDIDYSTLFFFNLIVSLLLMALIIISSGFIADFYDEPDLKMILIVSSLVLLINALRISQTVRLIKELQFKKKATYEFIAIVVASSISITLAFNDAGVWALVILQLITSLLLTILLWFFVGPLKVYKFSTSSFKQFYKFGINTTLASLLNITFDNIYQLIIGKYFSIEHAGFFYQAKKLQEMPTGIIQGTALDVIYASLARLQNSPNEFNLFYQYVVKIFTVLVAFMCLVIFFYSEVIITTLYGDEWLASVFYLQLLIVAAFFLLQEMFNRIIFKIFNKTEKILQLEVFKKGIQTLTILYGLWTMSIENLIYGFLLTSVLSFFINYYFARRVQNDFSWNSFFVIIKIIFIAVLTVTLGNQITEALRWDGLKILFIFPGLLLIYVLCLRLLNISNIYYDITRLLKLLKGNT